MPVAPRAGEWAHELSRFEIDLFRNGALIDHGVAANVLDGPLFALRHLVETLAQDPTSPPLAAGEIVTTGTLTRAFPVAAGEEWTTELREFRSKAPDSLRLRGGFRFGQSPQRSVHRMRSRMISI